MANFAVVGQKCERVEG